MRRLIDGTTSPSVEDVKALKLFSKHCKEFKLDVGGLDTRYTEAKRFQETYFAGTPYVVYVESYCCGCTATTLYKEESK